MRSMDHPNVVSLKHSFSSTTSIDDLFLNLVMEYMPESLYRVLKHYSGINQRMPLIFVKLYTYQIFRGLAYIRNVPGVCHRDVKPQNVLVDPLTHQVKICDFGSDKILVKGEVLGTPTREEIRCMKTNYTDLAIQRLNLIHDIRGFSTMRGAQSEACIDSAHILIPFPFLHYRSFSTRKGAQSKAFIDSAMPSHCKGLVSR
ncbi:uncharacterized protein A4U43_C06F8440 [Asparagus officinalis]|uniref:Protein kinase domain-containing protein n=1 Tax=Asparagus officinalis TaxID=4686 RepID=A0A5P1ER24_ASPOF|nr:uncharacterized protein A4U43_C06F8440 [Asparagus officinalis]